MKYVYRENIRYQGEHFPKLKSYERIISASIQDGDIMQLPLMILVIEKSIPFVSRIRK